MQRLLALAFIVCLSLTANLAEALDVPPLRGRVNDYAGVMSQEQRRSMESQLAQFEQETGHQVAVLTIPTLEGEDIEGFSIRVAESWKIGKKGFDNGVILVVAVKDRRMRLEVGYGLEGVLPDAIAKTITSNYIVPRFRSQDYAGGIIAGIDAVLKVIKQEPLPESARRKERDQGPELNSLAMFLITLAVFGLMAFASTGRRRRNSIWGPRGRGRGPIIFGPGGFGGGYYGGGGFGGGSGGGGFSGGGGSFGGGGASDSW
ncbi:MAG TPA: YgcG family protein [Candidatus Binatia bacterium]|nr:YgcG family protein [Candidatus Binatia bacterium]